MKSLPLPVATLGLVLTLAFSGCIPEESPIAPYDRGPIRIETLAIGPDYASQLYFDLDAGTIVQTTPVTVCDLNFRSDAGGNQIFLNSATISAAADMGEVPFESVTTTTKAVWAHDRPDGSWDSTAIGAWWSGSAETTTSRNHVYVIDRGYDAANKKRGYTKMMILGADDESYRIRYANLNGSDEHTVTIARDTTRNVTGFSFTSGTAVASEPPKGEWDIVMTRYTHVFYEPEYTPYSVTGVLLNRSRAAAVIDTVRDFASITQADVAGYSFTDDLNTIGYDWKTYDLNSGKYTVHPTWTYIVRRNDGFACKLRFVEFYNDKGERGFPRMEWQKL